MISSSNKGFTLVEILLIVFVAVFLIFIAYQSCCETKRKYIIYQNDSTFYANEYEEENGCLSFLDHEKEVKVCGNYIIKNNR